MPNLKMPKFKMVALTRAVEGREDEFNDWYQNYHLPEICAIPGVLGAQRFKQAIALQGGDDRNYLAIYDIEADDVASVLGAIGKAGAEGKMTPSDAADRAGAYTVVFGEHGERVSHEQALAMMAAR
ncbi:MAG: hypothetical protein RL367_154 [Pseudomonadota bacterium]